MRLEAANPIAPYQWEARYATGRLRQRDGAGWHTSREIDRGQLQALVLLGHPASPVVLPMPRPDRPVDEVLIRATTELSITPGNATAADARRWTFLGLRYGGEAWVLQIDPAAHLVTYTVPLPAGTPLDPVPCARCGG